MPVRNYFKVMPLIASWVRIRLLLRSESGIGVQSSIYLSPSNRVFREEPLAHSGVARSEPFKQKFEGSTLDGGFPRTPPF